MNPKSLEESNDPDWIGSFRALQRAARWVREEARRTNTDLVIVRDGKVVHVHPWELDDLEEIVIPEDPKAADDPLAVGHDGD